jgi:hypothetical protein
VATRNCKTPHAVVCTGLPPYNFSVLPALDTLLRGPADGPRGRGRRITSIRFLGDSLTGQSVFNSISVHDLFFLFVSLLKHCNADRALQLYNPKLVMRRFVTQFNRVMFGDLRACSDGRARHTGLRMAQAAGGAKIQPAFTTFITPFSGSVGPPISCRRAKQLKGKEAKFVRYDSWIQNIVNPDDDNVLLKRISDLQDRSKFEEDHLFVVGSGVAWGLKDRGGILGKMNMAGGPSDSHNMAKMAQYAKALKDALRVLATSGKEKDQPPLIFFHEYQGAHFPTPHGEFVAGQSDKTNPNPHSKCSMQGATTGWAMQRALQSMERTAVAELNAEPAMAGREVFHPQTGELGRNFSDVHFGNNLCGTPGTKDRPRGCLDCRHFKSTSSVSDAWVVVLLQLLHAIQEGKLSRLKSD